jgi:aminomethyltransferase
LRLSGRRGIASAGSARCDRPGALTIRALTITLRGLMLKRTPFYDFHVASGARMVDFAGWEMPIVYRGIVEEHEQTRKSGSFFDVSHMGRFYFTGKDVVPFLNKVLTRNVADQAVGQSRYSLVCNEGGGILDDIIVSRDRANWLLVCNASNREKLLKHFTAVRRAADMDFDLADQTESTAMIALQGPKVIDRLADSLPIDLKKLGRYRFETASVMGLVKLTVFRSGYTGEDGVELVFAAKMAPMAMKMLAGRGDGPDATIKPAGLGARDTLRLEAGMPLYGHELTEQIDPLSAGLNFAVDLSKDFIGAARLRDIHQRGPARKLVGLELDGRRIARQGAAVKIGDTAIGEVTSGTLSPTLNKSIAMAYVDSARAGAGEKVEIDLKGTLAPATIVPIPFYKRAK